MKLNLIFAFLFVSITVVADTTQDVSTSKVILLNMAVQDHRFAAALGSCPKELEQVSLEHAKFISGKSVTSSTGVKYSFTYLGQGNNRFFEIVLEDGQMPICSLNP